MPAKLHVVNAELLAWAHRLKALRIEVPPHYPPDRSEAVEEGWWHDPARRGGAGLSISEAGEYVQFRHRC